MYIHKQLAEFHSNDIDCVLCACICKSLLTIRAHFHRQRRFISLQKEGKRIVANNNTNVCVKISSTVAGSVCGAKKL